MRTENIAFIRWNQIALIILVNKNIKVVEPEIEESLVELTVAVNGPRQLGHGLFIHDTLRRLALGSAAIRILGPLSKTPVVLFDSDLQALGSNLRSGILVDKLRDRQLLRAVVSKPRR